jgi:NAD(P)-dependent dehydrogenase (short-subunit alcohol dehydrogenase family)
LPQPAIRARIAGKELPAMDNRESAIFVTGASSGIGNACATFLAKKGMRVYGTCRTPSSYAKKADEFFEMLPLDLGDSSSIAKAAEKFLSKEGRIDALVCCAGSGLVGSVEEVDVEEAEAVMDVDYFGTLRTIKAFLPSMREAGRGRIVLVGALEGLLAAPFQSAFSAAEFALEGLAQALRMEVARFGIGVGVLELTAFRTAFGQRRRVKLDEGSPYKADVGEALAVLGRDEAEGFDPLIAARAVHSMIVSRRMPARKLLGPFRRRVAARSRNCLYLAERRARKYFRLE